MTTTQETAAPTRPRRRRLQWTIRGMFILTTLVAVLLGLYFGHDRRSSARAVSTFRKLGGHVIYDYQRDGETRYVKFARALGEDYFGSVSSVRMDGGHLNQSQLDMLAHLPTIEKLLLSHVAFDGDNWQTLTKLPELRELHLWGCPFGDDDIEVLKKLPKLELLALNESMITSRGLKKLADFKHLKSLYLVHTMITPDDLAEIRAALPKCKIQDVGNFADLAAVLVMPDGRRTNHHQGEFIVKLATQGQSTSQESTNLRPSHLWFQGLPTKDGPVTLSVTFGNQYAGSVQVQVTSGVAEPRFVEVPMKKIP